jgi:hypothetical protein
MLGYSPSEGCEMEFIPHYTTITLTDIQIPRRCRSRDYRLCRRTSSYQYGIIPESQIRSEGTAEQYQPPDRKIYRRS